MSTHLISEQAHKWKDRRPRTSFRLPSQLSRQNRTGFLLTVLLLTAPYFIIRIPNTSFSVIDFFLILGLFLFILNVLLGKGRIPRFSSLSVTLIAFGVLFMIVSLLSGLEGSISVGSKFSMSAFLSGVFQYAFVMIVLPVLANWFLTIERIWGFFRMLSLGYLLPMLVTLILMSPGTPEALREYFFFAGRATGTFGNANAFAGVLVIMLPVYTILAISDRGFWKFLGTMGVVLSLLCLLLTASFGGVLIFLLLIIASLAMNLVWRNFPIRQYRKETLKLSLVIVLVMSVSVGFLLASPRARGQISDRISLATKAIYGADSLSDFGSTSLRISLIREAVDLIGNRWGGVWGHGLRQSTIVSSLSNDVHVLYLLLWIEGGLVLLLVFFAFLGIMIGNVFRLASLDSLAGTAVGLSILAFFSFGLVNPHLYLRYYWVPLLPALVDWHGYRVQRMR